jgi:hypothetical protein
MIPLRERPFGVLTRPGPYPVLHDVHLSQRNIVHALDAMAIVHSPLRIHCWAPGSLWAKLASLKGKASF